MDPDGPYFLKVHLATLGKTLDMGSTRSLGCCSRKLAAFTPYLLNSPPRKKSVKKLCPTTFTRYRTWAPRMLEDGRGGGERKEILCVWVCVSPVELGIGPCLTVLL